MTFSVKLHKYCDGVEKLIDAYVDARIGLDGIKENIKAGKIAFYGVYGDKVLIGFLLIRIDVNYAGSEEMVVMYSQCLKKIDRPFFSFLGELYDQIANGRRIRIHSERRAIDKVIEQQGFKFVEAVYIREPQ